MGLTILINYFRINVNRIFNINNKNVRYVSRSSVSRKYLAAISRAITRACAMFRDPCCPWKHYRRLDECWHAQTNPCHAHAPSRHRECEFSRSDNRDFVSIALNRWNVSCACQREGYEWDSRFGMCIGRLINYTGCLHGVSVGSYIIQDVCMCIGRFIYYTGCLHGVSVGLYIIQGVCMCIGRFIYYTGCLHVYR
jgi:hypothetical protein